MLTVTTKLEVRRERAGRKRLEPKGERPPAGEHVPRIARLLALAIKFKGMLDASVVKDQSELARLARVTQPRMTQILNLNFLAPDIQEAVLFLDGDTAVSEKTLRPMTIAPKWIDQRRTWPTLQQQRRCDEAPALRPIHE